MAESKATSSLCREMVVQILSRLPGKTLMRLKCVSKSWHVWIKDDLHPKALPSAVVGFYVYNTTIIVLRWGGLMNDASKASRLLGFKAIATCDSHIDASLAFLPEHRDAEIIDCCNGLLLCRQGSNNTTMGYIYYVCNPATKRWSRVPQREERRKDDIMRLAFDPFVDPYNYKIICVNSSMGTHMFSSERNGWEELSVIPVGGNILIHAKYSAKYWRGALYIHNLLVDDSRITRFDLLKRNDQVIKLPEDAIENPSPVFLGELGGSMCIGKLDGFRLQIWMLDEHGTIEWVLKHDMVIAGLQEKYAHLSEEPHKPHILAFDPHSKAVFIQTYQGVASYDLHNMVLKDIRRLVSENYILRSAKAFPISPCLLDGLKNK